MSDHSAIEWMDATLNPVRGCTKISPGCAHCYAEVFAERFRGVAGDTYEQGFDDAQQLKFASGCSEHKTRGEPTWFMGG